MIRKARENELSAVIRGYDELFRYELVHGSTTNWVAGVYPTEDTAKCALAEGSLYVMESEGAICGSVILNQVQPFEYEDIDWRYPAANHEVLVVHTLCIHPSKAGRGCGRNMIAFAFKQAQRTGCKVVRLDTWENNIPAISLYESMGFRLVGSAPMCLQGTISEQQVYLEHEVKSNDTTEQ